MILWFLGIRHNLETAQSEKTRDYADVIVIPIFVFFIDITLAYIDI